MQIFILFSRTDPGFVGPEAYVIFGAVLRKRIENFGMSN
jgi:hypothetical protein